MGHAIKMRERIRAAITLALILAAFGLAKLAFPQTAPVSPTSARPLTASAITPDAPGGLIHLDVSVADADGNAASGLRREDFSLLDNGQPAKILTFRTADEKPSQPTGLILVLDALDLEPLSRAIIGEESEAVQRFLRSNGGHFNRPVSVYVINDEGLWTVQHSDGDGNSMADDLLHNKLKIVRPFTFGPSTEINAFGLRQDAPSISDLKSFGDIATAERHRPGRKVMVWVGPRWAIEPGLFSPQKHQDEQDALNAKVWLSTLLRESRIVLFSLAVGDRDPRVGRYGEKGKLSAGPPQTTFMSWDRAELAAESGGLQLGASDNIMRQIQDCVRNADAFYTFTFDPPQTSELNEFHDLKIVVNKPGLTTRASSGYYDHIWYSEDRHPPPRAVTLKELEQMLATNPAHSDAEFARQLSEMALTERASATRSAALQAAARGKRTQEAVKILADASAFLDPPPDEVVNSAPPDPTAQARMLALMAQYLATTMHKLPNYIARQTTVRIQETPLLFHGAVDPASQPLHVTDTVDATLYYRDGAEVADPDRHGRHAEKVDGPQLATYGTFGPMIAGLLDAIQRNTTMTWRRWEHGANGTIAVFEYALPAEKSKYQAKVCCFPDADGRGVFFHYVGYHGEIAIDPKTGTVMRLKWAADLRSTTPIAQSDIVIEYGPVEIGGAKYICPLRSVSLMRARSEMESTAWNEGYLTFGPYASMLNEIEFSNYRLFRSSARILPELIPPPDNQ